MPNSQKRPLITLTTDFGTTDHYVGTMKCVIAGICPEASIVDITHEIAPADLVSAAYAVSQSAPFSPPGSIHVIVVDPGVGTARRAIALQQNERIFVAPDNGVLTLLMSGKARHSVRELQNKKFWLPSPSKTFHGRDLFAPAAAHLAAGSVQWSAAGMLVHDCVMLPGLKPTLEYQGRWRGMALSVDHFGNVITNLPLSLASLEDRRFTVQTNAVAIQRFCPTFGASENVDPFVYEGSSGYLEIAINQGNAAEALGIKVGDPLTLELHN
jgi:S-adenosylmethionine hydrolase